MSDPKKTIAEILESMPEFLTRKHLIQLGLCTSSDGAYYARKRGTSPDFIKIGGKIFYPKANLISLLESNLQTGKRTKSK